MHLQIRHEIRCRFDTPVRNLISILRLSPRSHEGQHVSDWWIDSDIDCSLRAGTDEFGNLTNTFSARGPIEAITIAAAGSVDTFDTTGVTRGTAERMPVDIFLRDTPLTTADAAIRDVADAVGAAESDLLGRLHALMDEVHGLMTPEPSSIEGGAAEALRKRSGGPSQYAHLFIAGARHLGIPTRYVSGYLVDEAAREAVCHAWTEAHIPDFGWIGFDCVGNRCPEGHHVRVASGLDALSAAFIRGTSAAKADHSLKVKITG